MMKRTKYSPLSYDELSETIERLGLKENLEWLGLILFVRNLVNRIDAFSDHQKYTLQKSVIDSLEDRFFTEENLTQTIKLIQGCFAENIKHELEETKRKLDTEKAFSSTLIDQIHVLMGEVAQSVNRQSSELNDFQEKTVAHIELQKDPDKLIDYIRGTIQRIVNEARDEASNWETRARSLENMAKYDNLLKTLHNRSFLDEYLKAGIERHRTSGLPLSLLMIDVDHFKNINDIWGHLVGDDVLKALAKMIRDHSDIGGGVACRYGGEELCIVFENTDEEIALVRAEALRQDVERYSFILRKESGRPVRNIHFTISIGVAQLKEGFSASDLIGAADKAMYRAKERGRNRVVGFSVFERRTYR